MQKQFGAVVVAAGNSTRMGGARSKVLELLGGKPLLCYSLEALCACPMVSGLAVVCREEDREQIAPLLCSLSKPAVLVSGGKERQDSVLNGVRALKDCGYLIIHDGARPMLTAQLAEKVCQDAVRYGASAAAVKMKDTCKLVDGENFVAETPDRESLMAVQTPQAFEKELYLYAVSRGEKTGKKFTDDCQLIEAAGGRVHLTEGDYRNIKVTTPEDLISVRAFFRGKAV